MANDKTAYGKFRELVQRIDVAFDTIGDAKKIPDNRVYMQKRATVYVDESYQRAPGVRARAEKALAAVVEETRSEGEWERDRIIAEQKLVIESLRNALSAACGAAVIDLGCRARAANTNKAAAE